MKVILLFLFTLSFYANATLNISKWEKTETRKGVDVFKAEVEGSDVVAFRGVSTIEAPMHLVLSVIYDVSRIKEWVSDVKTTHIIERKSIFEKIEYNRTDAPWPVSDRDFVYSAKTLVDKKNKTVEILLVSVEHPDAPVNEGVVRGQLHQSRYFLKWLDDKTTQLEVEILADPKGSLPKWVVNLFQSAWPSNTINSIRKIATEKGYQVHPDLVESIQDFQTAP